MASPTDYRRQLQALLPPGAAWTREPGTVLSGLLHGLGDEFARVDERAESMLDEADPRTAYELLPDWERVLGLPDECTAGADTISGRQLACYAKLAQLGGQTPAVYIALAATIGVSIVIHEFDPNVDDYDDTLDISDGKWRFVWRVEVLSSVDYQVARVGSATVGDRLTEGGSLDLECLINRAKPAHTHVIFTYPEF
jgi:uncharacterized protein YmfQ (DUF2313 family)